MFLIIGTVRYKRIKNSMGKEKNKEEEDLSYIKTEKQKERAKQQEFVLLKL